MTDATNTIVWEANYKPFGEAQIDPASTITNNFRFAGQYFDAETGQPNLRHNQFVKNSELQYVFFKIWQNH
jgi:uncharacterized protein RhaS with RHS repeats